MFSSIRDKILFVVITIMIVSLSLNTVLNYYVSGKSNGDSISTTLQSLADSHTATINEWLQSRKNQINSITTNFSMNDPIPILTQVADSGGFLNVDIAMSDKSTVSSDPSGIPDDYDPTSRDWYIEASKRRSTIITRPYHDVSSGKLTVTIAAPLIIGDTVNGVVEGDISLDEIIENVRAIHPTPKSYGMLIDNEGTIIAHTREDLTLSSINTISKNLKLSQLLLSPSPIEASISGSETYIIARPVQDTSWYVVIAVDKNEAERGMNTLLKASTMSLLMIIIASVVIVGYIMQQSISPLLQVRKSLDDFFAAGHSDLTKRLPVKGKDEIAQIAQSFNGFTEKLVGSMTNISQSSEEIRKAAEEMSNANNDLALRTEESAASLQQTSASLEEISSTVSQSATTAREANNAAQVAADVAIRGRESVENVIVTMNDIESVSSQIGSITSVINDIAFQTNILALNASVEAARAGEQGRGFAVVANEVRTLASRSAEAAKDISVLINKTVLSIASGVQEVENTRKTMNEIVSSISSVTVMMSEISKASDEQTKGISEINRAVSQLDNMVQQNVRLVDESRSTSTELLEQANDMSSALGRYGIK